MQEKLIDSPSFQYYVSVDICSIFLPRIEVLREDLIQCVIFIPGLQSPVDLHVRLNRWK